MYYAKPVKRIMSEQAVSKRIVFARLGGIGDVIHTLPLVLYLRKKYEQASIEYITSPNIAELLKNCAPYINKTWTFEKKDKNDFFKKLLECGKTSYFFNLHTSIKFLLSNLLYIRASKFFQYKKDNRLHAVINFAKTYEQSISGLNLCSKTLFVSDDISLLNKHGLKKDKYVCLVIGVGKERPNRAWAYENWIVLAKKILNQNKDYKVLFLGGEDERVSFAEWIKDLKRSNISWQESENIPELDGRALNLLGKLDLHEAAKIISNSECLISCDTGLLHLASALSVRVVGLYGTTSYLRSGPYTSNHEILTANKCSCSKAFFERKKCMDNKNYGICMEDISIDEVLEKISLLREYC